ncbi:MAG: hypothetical protein LBP98_04090 [Tannerella sp.]|jgi:hypothetical protein|nr:hypothetical protein [Tannerella sp.]
MEELMQHLLRSADIVSGHLNLFFNSVINPLNLLAVGGSGSLAMAGVIVRGDISAETQAAARRWHGSIDEKFSNIDKLVVTVQAHQTWGTPPQFQQLVGNRDQLAALIPKCRSSSGSGDDRTHRNTLLRTTVNLCVGPVKLWAYTQYNTDPNVFTIDDLHALGFRLPGEQGGRRNRTKATEAAAEVKVTVLSADMIRVIIDRAAGESAALSAHGWPEGVHIALIIITSADSKKEVCRKLTTHLHNDIRMPDGSHGQQFVIKAAFLRHVDDEPVFGPQPTFTMPYSTEDLAANSNELRMEN